MRGWLGALALCACPVAGQGLELSLPTNATLSREVSEPAGSYLMPVGPYADGTLPVLEVEGRIVLQAWRLAAQSITTLQILAPLRDQLTAAGYQVLLDCEGQECGGFDFRFGTRVLPAPDMFVDLFDYRFVALRKGEEAAAESYASLLISRSGTTAYIQVIHVAPQGGRGVSVAADARVQLPRAEADQPLAQALRDQGHVILGDLNFQSGSSDLGEGPFASLTALAAFLKSDPGLRVALVGHTDTVGGLTPNIALSKRRAASVLERLVSVHGVPRAQLDAEGMGYLSPIAPNLDRAGREANRRVEAVLLNSE
ncbi:OmpA family protein [Roseovarius faecimaris]|uniref:OmpA family protein n=1 Tax=Roseovarius faecimaris TaxID=2494550 RepID=A0A6I6J3E2_9RHOB|nr:OmpA family protein [Roseovarius faecimaris]QGX99308.1 OmpA family protein [Roseovarius faecimaris]